MKRIFTLAITILCCFQLQAKEDTAKRIIWAFPITSYVVQADERKDVQIVQVKLPPTVKFTLDKQVALLRGVAAGDNIDTGKKGYGNCKLIKGEYNYFPIFMDSLASKPKAGDLIYTLVPKTIFGNRSAVFYCAAHAVTFTNISDTAFYKPQDFLKKRTKAQDDVLMQKMLKDVRYTGNYFLKEDSTKNQPVTDGTYKGHGILEVMANAQQQDLVDFLSFVAARPRRYAGNRWKLSETFATWLVHGAPKVVEE